MKKWIPSPLMTGLLFLFWLMLNQSVEPAHLLLAAGLAIAVPMMTASLMEPIGFPVVKRPMVLFRLLAMALIEIIHSAVNVSRIILFARPAGLKSQFIRIPLDLRNPYGLALLSCLINSTPGTVWAEVMPQKHELILHVFDLHDEQWWIDTIKTQYEKPLIEIFE
jgi:multicomponent K+:H+ antiporter subunit E